MTPTGDGYEPGEIADWVAAREREAAWADLGLTGDVEVPDTPEWRDNQAAKAVSAELLASPLWPPGPSAEWVRARQQEVFDRAQERDPYHGMTYEDRQAAIEATWDLTEPDIGLEAAS